jgi:acetoacetyl-CoA reductase
MTQRTAFVTGAMGGLGTAICQAFAKDGYKVVAAYHPQFDNKDEWLKEMAAAGFKDFVCVAGDVSSLEDCQKMVAEAEANASPRSEERRVGKECRRLCRSRWSPYH